MIKSTEFINKLKNIADNYNTVYGKGGFGHPCTEMAIENLKVAYPDWYNAARAESLKKLVGKQFYIFDCVCFIKALLFWGWNGNFNATYGGAVYDRNTDYTEKGLLNACSFTSDNFDIIVPGEMVYMTGHVGVYIGEGQVIECSPKWKNGVQYSNLGNIAKYKTGNYRVWTSHGKLPGVDYSLENVTSVKTYTVVKGDSYWKIAEKILGNGSRYKEIQALNNSKSLYPGDVIKIPTSKTPTTDVETKKLVVGSKVMVKAGAKFCNGINPAKFVYTTTYDVLKISGDKVVIGIGKTVTGEMNISDLTIK